VVAARRRADRHLPEAFARMNLFSHLATWHINWASGLVCGRAGRLDRPGPDRFSPGQCVSAPLDKLLADRGMTLTQLSERVGVSVVNLSILKNGHATELRNLPLTRISRPPDVDIAGNVTNAAGSLLLSTAFTPRHCNVTDVNDLAQN
jgi:putative transcriptional regulator